MYFVSLIDSLQAVQIPGVRLPVVYYKELLPPRISFLDSPARLGWLWLDQSKRPILLHLLADAVYIYIHSQYDVDCRARACVPDFIADKSQLYRSWMVSLAIIVSNLISLRYNLTLKAESWLRPPGTLLINWRYGDPRESDLYVNRHLQCRRVWWFSMAARRSVE